jgi:hypothetical protein
MSGGREDFSVWRCKACKREEKTSWGYRPKGWAMVDPPSRSSYDPPTFYICETCWPLQTVTSPTKKQA